MATAPLSWVIGHLYLMKGYFRLCGHRPSDTDPGVHSHPVTSAEWENAMEGSSFAPVALTPCANYSPSTVETALAALFSATGCLDWVIPGMTVGIKANLVSAMKPSEAATTHPALLCALTRALKAKGASTVIVGDSPGGLYTAAFVNHVYDAAGMREVEAAGTVLNQDFGTVETTYPEATVLRSFTYTSWLDSCDAIINFSKLKSHGMMGMSAAAKNMFGVIPGTMKPEYHFRFPRMEDFAHMLVDIDGYFSDKVRLCLVDAVEGMEGNGPTKGTPRHLGFLMASTSPHAVDLVAAHLIGLSPEAVPTLGAAQQRGWIPAGISALDIRLVGDLPRGLDGLAIADFEHVAVRRGHLFTSHGKWVGKVLKVLLDSRPQLKASACVGCGKCASICPAKAIIMQADPKATHGKLATIDRSSCIRCFCCQEFCPVGAMRVHRTPIARLLVRKKK